MRAATCRSRHPFTVTARRIHPVSSILSTLKTWVDGNDREVARLRKTVIRINELEPAVQKLSDEELAAQTVEFKERLERGATIDDLLVDAFAVAREAGKRTLNMR